MSRKKRGEMLLKETIDFFETLEFNEDSSLQSITDFMSDLIQVKYVYIDQYIQCADGRVRNMSISKYGQKIEILQNGFNGAACTDVINDNDDQLRDYVLDNVPEDTNITDLNTDGLVRVYTHSKAGRVNGLIGLVDETPIDIGDLKPVLQLFSILVGNHFEIIFEKTHNQDLIEQLLFSEELYSRERKVLNDHAIVSTTDLSGKITYVNQKFIDISGYTRAELIGSTHAMIKSDEHDHTYYNAFYKAILSGRSWVGEFKNQKKDGQFYWVSATIEPIFDEKNIKCGYIAVRTDITDQKNKYLEAKIESAEKTKFLSTISHELRTPLNAIMGFSHLIGNGTLSEEQDEYLKIVQAASVQLEININQLILYEENILPKEGYCVLSDELNNAINLQTFPLKSQNISVKNYSHSNYTINLSSENMQVVLNNVIGNAVKYNKDKGKIHIQTIQDKNDFIKLSVTNTGAGIAEGFTDSIFKRFERGSQNNGTIPGNGLGLSIVKEILTNMGGTIDCASDGKTWSQFNMSLPLRIADENNIR